ncbi:large conductance mechanosensitive channel [Streptomyces sp. 2224.1]|uniref:large conductance mechanosensitive channel protein MscL n=1 Tax=unclassified Streptomyces TaxID=2593676 RepID=UPI000891B105|nr:MULTISPECIES: large conductance mechanosensitive channel protein MscL [unclassified Streptomyces]PBC82954.1 large conductance mechanosensitive channel [Streptomyces sp. 2321.6]SDR46070.1 large conductance mechanosensitive channel [Streptomyces sp. KS_16]SEC26365.1 large conductance mechanosensitive channel [Streptomyces sp. 2224.1]SEC78180.1 large conductance mechanosensitive channel [Streptomyces sp. 2133.1]SEE89163.1 large conductance mechanosensitive channel [Streptomyces sp. 2112.3]
MSESKGVLQGFKEFLMRGNVIELAVAVVVGAAFTNIVNAVVKGIINPIVGALGSQNLDHYQSCLTETCAKDPKTGAFTDGIYILWGSVLSAALTFLITAAVVYFLMILPINKWKERQAARKADESIPADPTEIQLLIEIRDALIAQRTGSPSAPSSGTGIIGTQKSQQ